MIEKFNGIIYFTLFLIHFGGLGLYFYQLIVNTAKFREKFAIDVTATSTMRMLGGMLIGVFLMALYILFVRPNGVQGTWAFFNLVFVQNFCVLLVNIYTVMIDKTGVRSNSIEAVIAPFVFTVLMAILIYGLSDKIYIY